jgi:hypothetical protein
MRRHRQRQRDAALGFFVRKFGLALAQSLALSLALYGALTLIFTLIF